MTRQKKAPKFASELQRLLKERGFSQKNVADKSNLSLTTINRIVKDGYGDINNVATILNALDLPHNVKFNHLVAREAELAAGAASEILSHGLHLYRSIKEYLVEFCPVPLERAYAAAFYGISYKEILTLAEECGIKDLQNPGNTWDILKFAAAFEKKFGKEAYSAILSKQISQNFPPVLQMDFTKVDPASKYVKVRSGDGKVIFDVPHVVLASYNFRTSGELEAHKHKGGIEFAYSLEGKFRLIYENKPYPTLMTPDGPIFIYDGTRQHCIQLANGAPGRLIIIRFYPDKKRLRGESKNNEVQL